MTVTYKTGLDSSKTFVVGMMSKILTLKTSFKFWPQGTSTFDLRLLLTESGGNREKSLIKGAKSARLNFRQGVESHRIFSTVYDPVSDAARELERWFKTRKCI